MSAPFCAKRIEKAIDRIELTSTQSGGVGRDQQVRHPYRINIIRIDRWLITGDYRLVAPANQGKRLKRFNHEGTKTRRAALRVFVSSFSLCLFLRGAAARRLAERFRDVALGLLRRRRRGFARVG